LSLTCLKRNAPAGENIGQKRKFSSSLNNYSELWMQAHTAKRKRVAALEQEGWIRRFEACEPRLSEAVNIYTEAGFEVCLEPLLKASKHIDSQQNREQNVCRACFKGNEDQYKTIFTKKAST
jgi:hypothetical protein